MTKDFKTADLVNWFEYYEDEIIRDVGLGLIVDIKQNAPGAAYEWTTYSVYKFKTGRLGWFESYQLDEIIPPVPER
jgi:hypothetical protein